MVGEIRDNETAQIAIQSALTGHLVFTTVHANNVVDVLGRFLNMGVEPYNFVSALNCILAQRLVRVICDSCRTAVHYPDEVLEASGLDPTQWSQVPLYEGQGCIECAGTGFRGRTAIRVDFLNSAKGPPSTRAWRPFWSGSRPRRSETTYKMRGGGQLKRAAITAASDEDTSARLAPSRASRGVLARKRCRCGSLDSMYCLLFDQLRRFDHGS